MIVAADGSGDYRTIGEAVEAIPSGRSGWTTIRIKQGIYKEKLHIDKPRIRLVGDTSGETVITYDDYALKRFPDGELYHTFWSYTFFIGADDFEAERLTFVNSAGSGDTAGQALAAYVDGDRAVFRSCRFLGHQDTLFTGPLPEKPVQRATFGGPKEGGIRRQGRHYYDRCYIEGDVDFIFGSATALFHRCEIFSKRRHREEILPGGEVTHGWITAASTPSEVDYGYVFHQCRLTGDAPQGSVYLGRPWRDHAGAAFLNCWMGEHIKPEGWHNWDHPERESTSRFAEYGNTGPGAAAGRRVSWARELSEAEADRFSPAQVLCGHDGWNPYEGAGRSVYLAGDSTVADYPPEHLPMLGWGAMLGRFTLPSVKLYNQAVNGRSSKSFIDEGRLGGILKEISGGDVLLIQFGHNDSKDDPLRYTSPHDTYPEYLRQYVEGARARGAHPVLLSPVSRRHFGVDGELLDTHGEYPRAMRAFAEQAGVPFFDLCAESAARLRELGAEGSKRWFVQLQAGEHPNYPEGLTDDTHLNEQGAEAVARMVAAALQTMPEPVSRLVREK